MGIWLTHYQELLQKYNVLHASKDSRINVEENNSNLV